MKELQAWADYRNRMQDTMDIILSTPYKCLPYYRDGDLLDGAYAGKAWQTLKPCQLQAELLERRVN